jgi:hypothetical protein
MHATCVCDGDGVHSRPALGVPLCPPAGNMQIIHGSLLGYLVSSPAGLLDGS